MQVHLAALGCRVNEAELETWSQALWRRGHRVVDHPEQAHVIVLNTCAVTREAAKKSRQLARRLHRKNPRAKVVVTGCYVELEPRTVAALDGVDRVVRNGDKEQLVGKLEQLDLSAMPQLAMDPDAPPIAEGARTRAFVKVQDGCRYRCTYCIVTVARGEERSRSIDAVVQEVNALQEAGYREVVLTGIHLGGYGSDRGVDLRQLVEALAARTTIPRIRIGSLEPWDLPRGFFEIWRQDERLCPHFHLPLQSGADATLRRMARRCSTADFARLVSEARAAIPEVMISTDVIVGFPGETEQDWRRTMAFVERVGFSQVHVFPFSPREGTAAARMAPAVAPAIKRARSEELHALAARMRRSQMERLTGTTRPVLFEGEGNPLEEGGYRWLGYTDNYLPVEMAVERDEDLDNAILPVTIRGVGRSGRMVGRRSASPL